MVVITTRGALTAASSIEHTFMMTLDHVGDQEAMVYAQLGQQPLVRTTVTSLERSSGLLSCLSARPPDLAFWTGTRPQVVTVSPSIHLLNNEPLPHYEAHCSTSVVPFLYSKRTAWTGGLVSRDGRLNVLWPLRPHQPWNYPPGLSGSACL